jgi:hypothetical protein
MPHERADIVNEAGSCGQVPGDEVIQPLIPEDVGGRRHAKTMKDERKQADRDRGEPGTDYRLVVLGGRFARVGHVVGPRPDRGDGDM